MREIKQVLTRKLTTDLLDRRFAQWVCFAAAPIILVLALRRFAALGLGEAQLIQGVISTLTLALAIVIMGFLIAPSERKGP